MNGHRYGVVGIFLMLVVLPFGTALAEEPKADVDIREFSFLVRVCEGDEFVRAFGEEAAARWEDCQRPLEGIPVVIVSEESPGEPVPTSKEGVAELGPFEVPRDAPLRLGIGCTEHVCMTLRLDPRMVAEGQNRFLYHTLTLEKMKEKQKSASKTGG